MKCPKCGYHSFEYLNACKKCGADLSAFKSAHMISPVILPVSPYAVAPADSAAAVPPPQPEPTPAWGADPSPATSADVVPSASIDDSIFGEFSPAGGGPATDGADTLKALFGDDKKDEVS